MMTVKTLFAEAAYDSDGAIRRMKHVRAEQCVDPASVIETRSRDVFETVMDTNYRAAVLLTSEQEKDALRKAFSFTRDRLTVKTCNHASVDPSGIVDLSIQPNAQEALEPVKSILESAAAGFYRMTGVTGMAVEVSKNFSLDVHRHPYPTLNFVLFDSATGWHETGKKPKNAGEGNIFFFRENFYHESTTRQEDALPKDRLGVIVRPDSSYIQLYIAQL